MQRICSSLSKEGYAVTLIGFVKKNSIPIEHKEYHQERFCLKFTKGKLFYIEYNLRLLWHFLKHQYDIYGAIDLDTVLPHYLASKKHSKQVILDAHEYYLGLPEIQNRPFTKWVWTKLEKWIYPKLSKAYTVNESIAKLYETEYDLEVEVVRNCPELEALPSIEKNEKYILYQGALNEGRGIEELIEAMQFINSASLKIAGTGEIDELLFELPKKFGVADKVEFLGYLQPTELLTVTQQAFIGVNLLHATSLNYYYSLTNKFFDYVHAELPQLSMDYPEYRLISKQFEVALLKKDLKPDTIAESLNQLIEDEDCYNKLVENCKTAKQHYNWANEEKKLIDFYKNLE